MGGASRWHDHVKFFHTLGMPLTLTGTRAIHRGTLSKLALPVRIRQSAPFGLKVS